MSVFNWRGRPKSLKPEDYNLSHFTWVQWGRAVPGDVGSYGRVLLYRNEVVYSITHHPIGEVEVREGDARFEDIADIARFFMATCAAGKVLATSIAMPGSPDVPLQVYATRQVGEALQKHPQFEQIQEIFLGMGWLIEIVPHGEAQATAVCRYQP